MENPNQAKQATWLSIDGVDHKLTRAAKEWVCQTCGRTIQVGDYYYGARSTTSYCIPCCAARQYSSQQR